MSRGRILQPRFVLLIHKKCSIPMDLYLIEKSPYQAEHNSIIRCSVTGCPRLYQLDLIDGAWIEVEKVVVQEKPKLYEYWPIGEPPILLSGGRIQMAEEEEERATRQAAIRARQKAQIDMRREQELIQQVENSKKPSRWQAPFRR